MKTRATLTLEKETHDLELELEGDVRVAGDEYVFRDVRVVSAWARDVKTGEYEPEQGFDETEFSRSELGLAEDALMAAYERWELEEAAEHAA